MEDVKELKRVESVVKRFLKNEIETRNDDDQLAYLVESYFNPEIANLPYKEVRTNRYKYFTFSAESIRRTRQKIQEMYPELRAEERIRDKRLIKMKEYEEYARYEFT